MRVIAGRAKGTQLWAPDHKGLRPTTDRTKQILFDTLFTLCPAPKVALDLFAGTGSLGIEILSRGAEKVYFVEKSRKIARAIERNLEKTHLTPHGKVIVADAFIFLKREPPELFDCIFVDPPYGQLYGQRALSLIDRGHWLTKGGVCIVEETRRMPISIDIQLECLNQKECGDTILYFFGNV